LAKFGFLFSEPRFKCLKGVFNGNIFWYKSQEMHLFGICYAFRILILHFQLFNREKSDIHQTPDNLLNPQRKFKISFSREYRFLNFARIVYKKGHHSKNIKFSGSTLCQVLFQRKSIFWVPGLVCFQHKGS